jgi:hypothetical protein
MKLILKKLILVIAASLFLTVPLSYAEQDINTYEVTINMAKSKVADFAGNIGLTLTEFLQASGKWQRLKSGKAKHNMKELSEVLESSDYQYAIETGSVPSKKDFLNILNTQKSALANYLGIDVYKLENFLKHYELAETNEKNLLASTVSKDSLKVMNKTNTEVIIVRCRDFCNNGYDWSGNMLSLVIWHYATAANVPSYAGFIVEFRDYRSNEPLKREEWKYNNFSGAWFEEKSACSTCNPF